MLQTSLSSSRRSTFKFSTDSFTINSTEYKYKKLVLFEEKENSESWICLVTQPKMDLILLLSVFTLASGNGNEKCHTSGGNHLNQLLGCLTSMRRTFDAEVNTTAPPDPSVHGRGGAFSNLMSNIPRESDSSKAYDENGIEKTRKKIVTVNEWSYVFPWRASCSLEALLSKQQRLVPYYVANSSSSTDLHPSSGRSSPSLNSTADTERPASAPLSDFKNKPLCDEVVRHVARQLAGRIKWIHQHGMTHGAIDLKNIYLTPNLTVIWAPSYTNTQDTEDGIAGIGKKQIRETRWLPPECFYDFSGVSVDTGSGLSGTIEGHSYPLSSSSSSPTGTSPSTIMIPRERSGDIWSFGCVLLSLTLAQLPFPNDNDALIQTKLKLLAGKHGVDQKRYDVSVFGSEVVEEIIGAPLSSLESRFPGGGISPVLLDLICRCLSIHPLRRPSACDILAHPFLSVDTPFECQDFILRFGGEEAGDPCSNTSQTFRQRVYDAFVKEPRLPVGAVSLLCKNAWLLRSMASLHHTRRALMKKREKDLQVRNLETMSRVNEPLPKWDVYVFVCQELIPFLSNEYTITPMFIHESYCLHKDEDLHERSVLWAMMVAELVPEREPHFMLHQQLSNHGMRGNVGGMRRTLEALRARITGHPSSSMIPVRIPMSPNGYPLEHPSFHSLEDAAPTFISGVDSVRIQLPLGEAPLSDMTSFGSGWLMGDGYGPCTTSPTPQSGRPLLLSSGGGGSTSPFLLPPPRQNVRSNDHVSDVFNGSGSAVPLLTADRPPTSRCGTGEGERVRHNNSYETIVARGSSISRSQQTTISAMSSLAAGGDGEAILLLTPAEEGHGPHTNRKRHNPFLGPYEGNAVPDIEYLEPSIILSAEMDGDDGLVLLSSGKGAYYGVHHTPSPRSIDGKRSLPSCGEWRTTAPPLAIGGREEEAVGGGATEERAGSVGPALEDGKMVGLESTTVAVPLVERTVQVVFREQASVDEKIKVLSNLKGPHYIYDSLRRPISSVDPRGYQIYIAVGAVIVTVALIVLAAVLIAVL